MNNIGSTNERPQRSESRPTNDFERKSIIVKALRSRIRRYGDIYNRRFLGFAFDQALRQRHYSCFDTTYAGSKIMGANKEIHSSASGPGRANAMSRNLTPTLIRLRFAAFASLKQIPQQTGSPVAAKLAVSYSS
jgi:hypothetical protein